MIDTLASMAVPVAVLIVVGAVTIGLGWWAAVVTEGKDEWLIGADDE